MSFTAIEALKRALVLDFIETNAVQNTNDTLNDANKRAMETAKTVKGIDMLFNQPTNTPIVDPISQTQPQQPNIFEQQTQAQQPPQQKYSYDQIVELINGFQQQLVQMQQQVINQQKENFEGMRSVYEALKVLGANIQKTKEPQK